jgi:ribonuclease HII
MPREPTSAAMQYLIGTDEAGYGPNLGPLVISATLWQVPDGTDGEDLYERLAGVIVPTPEQAARNPTACVTMADSKVLYRAVVGMCGCHTRPPPGKGLRHLERGLWAALALLGKQPQTWSDVWVALAPEAADDLRAIPWYAEYDAPVPLEVEPTGWDTLVSVLRSGLAAAGVRLLELRSRAVFPRQFNEVVERHGSKGAALSHLTLELVSRAMEPLEDGPISVICDKHGGRNRYGRLLAEHFPDRLIEIYGEHRRQSIYRFGPSQHRVQFCFRTKAEECLPAALASMASKYLRELAMRALNAFWCGRLVGLRPTAGYPQDAKRFRTDIAPALAELKIDDRVLWREK